MSIRQISFIFWMIFAKSIIAEPAISKLDFTQNAKSQFGQIMIKESDIDGDSLFFNQHKIDLSQEGYSFRLGLMAEINTESHMVYILWGGSGGTMDMDNNLQCKFINLSAKNKYQVSSLTYCPAVDRNQPITIKGSELLVDFNNVAAYAESTDIGKLSYDVINNKVKIIQATKNDNYYKAKFAKYTTHQIVDEAIHDNNFDAETNSIMTCHVCGMYGTKYCFKFQSLQNPSQDKYYAILKKSCSN